FSLFTHTDTTAIYTLSLHDALPIFTRGSRPRSWMLLLGRWYKLNKLSGSMISSKRIILDYPKSLYGQTKRLIGATRLIVIPNPVDRKSTRLNSSHVAISYAVFCLKK